MPRWTEISPNDPRLVPFNRQDDSDPAAPAWIYGGCGVRFRFTGPTLIGFFAKPHAELGSWIGVRIDGGAEIRLHIPAGHDGPILLACGLELGEHEALIYKRSDAWSRRLIFKGLAAQGDWLPGPNGPTRRVEFYGDSVLAGGMAEAPGFEGVSDDQVTLLNRDDEMTSPWFGWGWLTARRLGVEPHVLGVGGLALQDGTGWFGDPNMVGLATTWNTSDPNPEMLTPCDLSRFRPDAVVVGIGQNDGRTLDIQDAATRESWT
ncbi:MAG: hypothetical protein MH204_05330, partial [Fimbriimonadaceae bacterium]|nr:hypothetical protein [Fimbriimonadaceae bacterium]